jgi:hypothetical protein
MAGTLKPPPLARPAHRLSWAVFGLLLLFAALYVIRTGTELPPMVASHFDAAGAANSFMRHDRYIRLVLGLAIGVPALVVGLLAAVYSNASQMRLPNSAYWLAPQRIERTRGFLIQHGVWFGCGMVMLVCFVHHMELGANRRQPAHLSTHAFTTGVLIFLIATAAWIGAMMFALRRPPGE